MSYSNIFNRKAIESESFPDRFLELSIQEICQLSPKKTGSEQTAWKNYFFPLHHY